MRVQARLRRGAAWLVAALCLALFAAPASAQRKLVVNLEHVDPEVQQRIVASFKESHPDVEVEIVPKGEGNLTRILGGAQLDVVQMDVGAGYLSWIRQGLLRDLTPYLDRYPGMFEDWAPQILKTQEYQGKTYLIPRGDVGVYMLWTNRTMFEQAGLQHPSVDWTHDDFIELALRMRRDTNGDGEFEQWMYSWESWYGWRPWFENRGGVYVDPSDPTKLAVDSEATIAALEWMAELVRQQVVPSRQQVSGARGAFFNGRIAMAQAEARKAAFEAVQQEWEAGVTIEPAGPAGQSLMMTWQGFGITTTAADPDLAFEWIRHVVRPEFQREYITRLYSPTVNIALNAEYFGYGVGITGFMEAFTAAFQRPIFLAVPMIPEEIFGGFNQAVTWSLNQVMPARQAVGMIAGALKAKWEEYLLSEE